jgi:predicted thioredoxin/glutaredoxin
LKNEFSDASKKHIDNEMIDSLIEVAMHSSFDSSPLVIKQKIRNIIKQKIKKTT